MQNSVKRQIYSQLHRLARRLTLRHFPWQIRIYLRENLAEGIDENHDKNRTAIVSFDYP